MPGAHGPTPLSGISAVPVTPFAPDGGIDEAALRAVVRRIVDAGIDLVVTCGNTGEQASLTAEEANRVAAITLEAARAAQAAELGAAGVMVHFPTDPYLSDDGLVRYYGELASATDGVVVPYVRARGLSPRVLDSLAERENVVALKYAVPDVLAFAAFAARYGDAMLPICGLAEMWAPFFWLAGARGFTSGLANVFPQVSVAMLEALRAGEFARAMELWRMIEPFERLRARHADANNVPVVKEAMAMLGVIGATVRPPLAGLSETDRAELATIVEHLRDSAA
jgi:4-hydroxy-tetrahydrodipicolinate synthase